ncbi:MAG: hypothetical protein AB7G21_00740 [Dehalococcoidia bacterium]
MNAGGAGTGEADDAGHEHTQECAELYAAWLRYHRVAEDESGLFSDDDRASAARERDMFERQMRAVTCDPFMLLALEASEDFDAPDEAGGAEGR